jgi:hypothetical protein
MPELRATTFTGPGEMEAARANAAIEINRLIVIVLRFKVEP